MDKRLDVVYILGDFSKTNDFDFRMSLRSICKHIVFRRVHVVGHLPDWVQNVWHTPGYDVYPNKQSNAIEKILLACESSEVSADFLLMNDDFLFLSDFSSFPVFHCGTLSSLATSYCAGRYRKALLNTCSLFDCAKLKNYEIHFPFVVNKKRFLSLFKEKYDYVRCPVVYRSIYFHHFPVKSVYSRDFKAYRFNQFKEMIKKKYFVSTDNAFNTNEEYLFLCKSLFPMPCKFEKPLF